MKLLVQRVAGASVSVEHKQVAKIGQGLLVYVGLGHEDTGQLAQKAAGKLTKFRVFERDNKLNDSVLDLGLELLLVPQFTLMAQTSKGLRPSFEMAMKPDLASNLFAQFVDYCAKLHPGKVASGVFGADMQVESVNLGPINFLLEF